MDQLNDRDYYRRREASERALAQDTADPCAARVHAELADLYAGLLAGNARPKLRLVG